LPEGESVGYDDGMSVEPPIAERPVEPLLRWQRFTLLDLFALQLAIALGLGLASMLGPSGEAAWFVPTAGVAGGLLGYGPLVLLCQRLFHGRKHPLSTGESLWVALAALWTLGIGLLTLLDQLHGCHWLDGDAAFLLTMLVVMLFYACDVGLAMLAYGRLDEFRKGASPPPCRWTDRVGTILVLGLGGFVAVGGCCFLTFVSQLSR
jgi:hypothetical protein